eukprot:CAMPEP_0114516902 /NCGR_PEP_ID=MMETSP0109-20121206/17590_1 /TAXON_ID=29199 /ORGANISM="Chlorarachnion reptans, Strain CCCM449" /LENGTH=362 /DNA_ID=CAMNT_0001697351 /DNA_START=27 /DNA_END=1115 /DNA_ORIENTATION=-
MLQGLNEIHELELNIHAQDFASQCLDFGSLNHGMDLGPELSDGKATPETDLGSDTRSSGPSPEKELGPPGQKRPRSRSPDQEGTVVKNEKVEENSDGENVKGPKKKAAKRERNKKAASDYRKRRKAYVEGLEGKIKTIQTENDVKKREIESLKANNQFLYHQNISLLQQLNYLKSLVCIRGGNGASCTKKSTVAVGGVGTVLMCVTLSLAVLSNRPTTIRSDGAVERAKATTLQTVQPDPMPEISSIPTPETASIPTPETSSMSSHVNITMENGDRNSTDQELTSDQKLRGDLMKILGLDGSILTNKMKPRDIILLEARTSFIQRNSKDLNFEKPGLRLDEILNLNDTEFCKRLRCTAKALK